MPFTSSQSKHELDTIFADKLNLLKTQWRRNQRFRQFNEPGLPISWGTRATIAATWVTKMSEMIQLHSAHTIFHSRRGHSRSFKTPPPALNPSGFKLRPEASALRVSQLRAPIYNLLLNQGPSEPCYATVKTDSIYHRQWIWRQFFFLTLCLHCVCRLCFVGSHLQQLLKQLEFRCTL